uniref:Uncharacterized protein n=1 Tax=Anopheles merus TaxID=30066 RepID=A0A182VE01_ANOME
MSQQLNSHGTTMLGSIANSIGTNNSIACSMGNNIPNNLTTIPNSMIATMSSPAGNASNGPTSNGANSNGANGSSNGPSSTPATPTNNCQSIRYCSANAVITHHPISPREEFFVKHGAKQRDSVRQQ